MNLRSPFLLKAFASLLILLVLGAIFYAKAWQNYTHQDYPNSNFFIFWLSGRMAWTGENPYDASQWLAGHIAHGATWRPNRIFPYPLPLAFIMIPLGWLSLGSAYVAWQMVSQIVVAASVYALLHHWRVRAQQRLFLPLVIFLLFFGPVFLSLQIGSVGPLALGAILLAILCLERKRGFLAGALLALTILKPPQGLTILILAGVWLLARRDWRALAGMGSGGVFLLLLGFARDPAWLLKFRAASEVVLDRTLGVHSNIFSFAYLACGQEMTCMWILGTPVTVLLLSATSYYLWRNATRLAPWEAFNIILPVGFVTTIYLWSYDQLTYVIPITWIAAGLVERARSYIPSFVFLIVLDAVSMTGLLIQATTHKDRLSIVTTVLTLGLCLLLMHAKGRPGPRPAEAAG